MRHINHYDYLTLWSLKIKPIKILAIHRIFHFYTKIFVLLTTCFSLFNNQLIVAQEPLLGANGKTMFSGTVRDINTKSPLVGSTIKNGRFISKSDEKGRFSMTIPFAVNQIYVSHLGYKDTVLTLTSKKTDLDIQLVSDSNQIEVVDVVSTGYQIIPKERATGSFAHVDSETLNRSPGMNILSRLNGVTNGLLLDRNTGNADGISVRGRSTIFSSTRPLIVLDNFPYEGDLDNINPNDIESVSVLKDATAASIWGVRSGNGVIVITTKKAKEKLAIDYQTNVVIRKKPNLFTEQWMTSSDYIDSEIWLYEKGYYSGLISTPYQQISPVIELMEQLKDGKITSEIAIKNLELYRNHDVRSDLQKYFFRNFFQHQNHLSISSSSKTVQNVLSLGLDKTNSDKVGQDNERVNIRNSNQWKIFNEKISLNSDMWYSKNSSYDQNSSISNLRYPYERLVDDQGNALEASGYNSLRPSYTDTVGNGLLLDWKYRPLDELRKKLSTSSLIDQQIRFQINIASRIYRSFNVGINYLNSNNWIESSNFIDENSFYARNLINQFSSIDYESQVVVNNIPKGGILDRSLTKTTSQYGRIQLDWNETLFDYHTLSGILGMEWRQDFSKFEDFATLFGYNSKLESFSPVDDFTYFQLYHSGNYSRIDPGGGRTRFVDNNRSLYGLLSYSYKNNLALNLSLRKDASNVFGVKANQKGVPLWSIGAAYSFQNHIAWEKLDRFKLRATFGYNGNIDKNTTAFLTSKFFRTSNLWGKRIDIILNPPNSTLRWEKIQNLNIGLDYSFNKSRFSGSIEYFQKRGQDLMGESPLSPQTGMTKFYGNVANTLTKGVDVQFKSRWIDQGEFNFQTDFIFNAVKDQVTDYLIEPGSNTDLVTAFGIVPVVGSPINSLIVYRSKGLNETGDPVGVLVGKSSVDYISILNGYDRSGINILGSKVPTYFGSFRNSFSFGNLAFSFQILYRWGHYLSRPNSFNSDGLISGTYKFADYKERWQRPGDESITDVPRFVFPFDFNRQEFYQKSDKLAIKAGMAKLQDVRLSYNFNPKLNSKISSLQINLFASNLGVLWKQNKKGLNPEQLSGYKLPAEWSMGLKFNY